MDEEQGMTPNASGEGAINLSENPIETGPFGEEDGMAQLGDAGSMTDYGGIDRSAMAGNGAYMGVPASGYKGENVQEPFRNMPEDSNGSISYHLKIHIHKQCLMEFFLYLCLSHSLLQLSK